MNRKASMAFVTGLLGIALLIPALSGLSGPREGRITLRDRQGAVWDVTEAAELGFEPDRFHHGLGRGAIVPLDGSSVIASPAGVNEDLRVIGIERGGDTLAVSVRRLTQHEVANVNVGGAHVSVAY